MEGRSKTHHKNDEDKENVDEKENGSENGIGLLNLLEIKICQYDSHQGECGLNKTGIAGCLESINHVYVHSQMTSHS